MKHKQGAASNAPTCGFAAAELVLGAPRVGGFAAAELVLGAPRVGGFADAELEFGAPRGRRSLEDGAFPAGVRERGRKEL